MRVDPKLDKKRDDERFDRFGDDTESNEDLSHLNSVEKLLLAVEASIYYLPSEVAEEIKVIFTPATLATMVGVFAVYLAAHATGIGQAMDIGMLIAGGIYFGLDAFAIFKDIAGFAGAINATTPEELVEAGEHLASAIAKIGVDAVMTLLTSKVADEIGKGIDNLNQVDEVHAHSDDVNPPVKLKGSNNDTGQKHGIESLDRDNFSVHPSTPVGRRGDHIQVPPPANARRTIEGRTFSGHALDRMQEQGIPSSAVENAIQYGEKSPARNNAERFYDKTNNITVIVDKNSGLVITADFGNFNK